jgi:enoyl-CoA hydratase/carnithine racemase
MLLDLARAIAAKPPEAVAAAKRLARHGLSETILSRFEHEIETINRLLAPGVAL